MAYDDLLDDEKLQKNEMLWEVLQWWEQRRIRYNLIVGGVGLLGAFFKIATSYNTEHLIFLLTYLGFSYAILANIAYLLGWVPDLLLRYYFNIKLSISIRNILFWLGILISIVPLLFVLSIL